MSSRPATGANTDATNIKVVSRFRPINRVERESGGGANCVTFLNDQQLELKTGEETQPYKFTFDRNFHDNVLQSDVYDYTGAQIVEDVFKGYNGTIFVYGQTGSGKTYTMMGPSLNGIQGYCDDEMYKGIIPRVVEQIFTNVEEAEENVEFTIKVSFVEIYMERIRDLFDPTKTNLQLHEDFRSARGVYVADATEAYVSDADEVFRLLREGASNRAVASTRMNDESSRSHSIFCITITQSRAKLDQRTGKLFLVDLAGSEKVGKTKAEGLQLEEAKLINKSLTTLGMVINSLTDKKSTHVPYRDSKLTRLLQDSLGGNSRTTLIVCATCAKYNDQETLSTLRFGERAKSIKNKAKINREWTVAELKILLAKAEKEIAQLKMMKGVEMNPEEAQRAQDVIYDDSAWQEERTALLEEKDELTEQLLEMRQKVEKSQATITHMQAELDGLREEDDIWEAEYEMLQKKFEDIQFLYDKERQSNQEKTKAIKKLLEASEDITKEMAAMKTQVHHLQSCLDDQGAKQPDSSQMREGSEATPTPEGGSGSSSALKEELATLRTENEALKASLSERADGGATELILTQPKFGPLPEKYENLEQMCSSTEFAELKETLLKDLTDRCEKVIDYELALDEARDAYKQLVINTSNKALKKKVMLLEQKSEQQTENFQEVFNENSTLRLEMQLAEKKLAIRNERIENLKAGLKEEKRHLKELQEQFGAEREKYKAEGARSKEEVAYWKEKCLAREKGQQNRNIGGRSKVVKVIRGGQKALAVAGGPGTVQATGQPTQQNTSNSPATVSAVQYSDEERSGSPTQRTTTIV
eukprot:TRINITY_DN66747_c0_g1_i1.p1 TRINITY_DN66747_c0_g1~~TRINITY_DN66747_c0_g1_i1.p1  ORF type:complete len:816 (+),score=140.21 TRINITY_DN66747_c0_g1_i1:53-2500(+)